jgi:hypothetical protein
MMLRSPHPTPFFPLGLDPRATLGSAHLTSDPRFKPEDKTMAREHTATSEGRT